MIAALHPVNALVLTYAALSLAKRSSPYWRETDAEAAVIPARSAMTGLAADFAP
jgi:hypothetical protein